MNEFFIFFVAPITGIAFLAYFFVVAGNEKKRLNKEKSELTGKEQALKQYKRELFMRQMSNSLGNASQNLQMQHMERERINNLEILQQRQLNQNWMINAQNQNNNIINK